MTTEPSPPKTDVRLSVAMIVRDEAARIATALDSVRTIADDLVVVDTGSRDETVALAAAGGARVLQIAWTDDFAAARNAALEACLGRWVLVLDADEALAGQSLATLAEIVAGDPGGPTAFEVVIRNWTHGSSSTGFDHRAVRLFSRHPELCFAGRIHEQLTHRDQGEAGIAWHLAPGLVIDHWGYLPEERRAKGKSERNQRLLQQAILAQPQDPTARHHLGMWHWSEQQPAEALAAFEQALALAEGHPLPPAYRVASLILIVASHVVLGRYAEALAAARPAETLCLGEPDFWFNVGLAHQGLAEHDAAIAAFHRCLALRGCLPTMAEHGTSGWKAHLALAISHEAQDDREAAMAARWQALQDFPFQPELHGRLWAQACLDDDGAARAEAFRLWQILPVDNQTAVAAVCIDTLQGMDAWPLAEKVAREFILTLPAAQSGDQIHRYAAMLNRRGALRTGSALRVGRIGEAAIGRRLADFLAESGDWAAFERICRHAIAEGIDAAYLATRLGTVLLQAGETEQAEDVLKQAAELGSPDPNVWNNLGVIALTRQAMTEAEAHFLKAVEVQPEHVAANLNLIRTAWWFRNAELATKRLGTMMMAFERLMQEPPGPRLETAVRDLGALQHYFRDWDRRRRQDATIVAPEGTDVFLQSLYVIWQLIGARLAALQPRNH